MAITINLTQLKRKKRKDGTIPVYIRVTENRKSRYKGTGISVKPKYWLDSDKYPWVSSSHPRSDHFNMKLKRQLNEIHTVEEELYKKDELSMDSILSKMEEDHDPRSITQKGIGYKEYLQSVDRYWEQRHFTVVINNLEEFIKKENKPDQIDGLNRLFVEDFQTYLVKTVGNANNTVRNKLQRMKGFTDWLLKNNDIKEDPFRKVERVKAKKVNTKTKLTHEQIQAIEKLELDKGSELWHVRNYFLYSFYNAGIRFGDLCTLEWKNIIDSRLMYQMHKTGGKKSIRQLEPMQKILNHYKTPDTKPTDYIFPILNRKYTNGMALRKAIGSENAQINLSLKELAKKAGIQANVSFHVSRHSWAQYGLKNEMDLYSISKALGHSDLKVTEGYLKDFDEELLDKSMEKLYG